MINQLIDSCDSTNEFLKSNYSPNLKSGSWIAAKKQLQGKGRAQHEWESLEGNLHLSIFVRSIPSAAMTWIPLQMAITARNFISFYTPEDVVQVKWPNDLMVKDQKLGGVLCEVVSTFQTNSHDLVCGIGVNVNEKPKDPEINKRSVSLFDLNRTKLNVEEMIPELVECLRKELSDFDKSKIESLKKQYARFQWLSEGDEVSWSEGDQKLSGSVLGLGKYGDLTVLESQTKKQKNLFSEEIKRLVRRV